MSSDKKRKGMEAVPQDEAQAEIAVAAQTAPQVTVINDDRDPRWGICVKENATLYSSLFMAMFAFTGRLAVLGVTQAPVDFGTFFSAIALALVFSLVVMFVVYYHPRRHTTRTKDATERFVTGFAAHMTVRCVLAVVYFYAIINSNIVGDEMEFLISLGWSAMEILIHFIILLSNVGVRRCFSRGNRGYRARYGVVVHGIAAGLAFGVVMIDTFVFNYAIPAFRSAWATVVFALLFNLICTLPLAAATGLWIGFGRVEWKYPYPGQVKRITIIGIAIIGYLGWFLCIVVLETASFMTTIDDLKDASVSAWAWLAYLLPLPCCILVLAITAIRLRQLANDEVFTSIIPLHEEQLKEVSDDIQFGDRR